MHVYKIVRWGELNRNCNLDFTQLFYAWLQMLKRDLHGNENLRRFWIRNIHLIFWDGSIDVISFLRRDALKGELRKDQDKLGRKRTTENAPIRTRVNWTINQKWEGSQKSGDMNYWTIDMFGQIWTINKFEAWRKRKISRSCLLACHYYCLPVQVFGSHMGLPHAPVVHRPGRSGAQNEEKTTRAPVSFFFSSRFWTSCSPLCF